MSKKINKARIIARLTSRFSLQRSEDEPFELTETVMPITNVDELVKITKAVERVVAHTAVGWVTAHTVPSGKKWKLICLIAAVTSGTGTIDELGIIPLGYTGTYRPALIKLATPVATMRFTAENKDIILNEGDKIDIYFAVHSVNGNLTCAVLIEEEDAY